MKMAKKCDMMAQKMAKKAGFAGDTTAANDAKAASEMQSKMSDQYKAVASAEETFGKAQQELRNYKKSLKQSKKDSDSQGND